MTSPEDDGLEQELRRALSEAANAVEPGPDGLDKIRDRIGDRPPRPWLISVLFGVVERARYWTWRGHWTWTARLPRLPGLREWRSRRSNFPRWGIGSLRLAVMLAGITVIAVVTLGVQPFRQAILQASAALSSSQPRQVSARTEDNGTGAIVSASSTPTLGGAASGGPTRAGSTPGASPKSGTAKARQASAAKCSPTAPPDMADPQPSPTATAPDVSGTTPAAAAAPTAGVAPTTGATPTTGAAPVTGAAPTTGVAWSGTSSPATSASTGLAQPVDTSTTASTCPMTSPTTSPPSSPPPAPAVSSPAPSYTGSTSWPSPTGYPSPPRYDRPSPSGSPSWSWPDTRHNEPWYSYGPRQR